VIKAIRVDSPPSCSILISYCLRNKTAKGVLAAKLGVSLQRHVGGDWGDVCAEDKLLNDRALVEGTRILSAYRATNGTKF